MLRLLLNWVLSALALIITSKLVPGLIINGFGAALWAVIVIGFVNATLGLLLKVITFPLTLLTLGIFWIIINAFMLKLASWFAPGFYVQGFWAAFIGAIVLMLVNMILKWAIGTSRRHERQYR
jgi:putative membrane protein